MNVSTKHGEITLAGDDVVSESNATHVSYLRFSGPLWKVNRQLVSLEYTGTPNWHGWDKVTISLNNVHHDGLRREKPILSYPLHLYVAAINDPPSLRVTGFSPIPLVDEESGDDHPFSTTAAYLVPAYEDTAVAITGVTIEDADVPEIEDSFVRPRSLAVVGNGIPRYGARPSPLEPLMAKLSVTAAYGMIAMGGRDAELVTEDGGLGIPSRLLVVGGTLRSLNESLSKGIVYTPKKDWHGIDLVQVSW